MRKIWLYLLSILFLAVVLVWLAVLTRPSESLKVIACDVGQGDAILIVQNDTQVLIDGGPGNKVISCLSKYMPFWDRKVEVVVMTHPDADHSAGLVDVFENYSVGNFVTTETNRDTDVYKTLKDLILGSEAKVVYARKGETLKLGSISFDILHPSISELSGMSGFQSKVLGSATSERANDYSIVMEMRYGDFNALFTGDIEDEVSDLVADESDVSDLDFLKIPHHGSKNGLSQKLLDEVRPELTVISVGKNNRFGHPHDEVLKMISDSQTKLLRTDLVGDVVVETNGKNWRVVN